MTFPADCSHCSAQGHCRVCVTDVPHFKEVIFMAFTCEEECGWRDVEVKGGGAVPLEGHLQSYNTTQRHPQ
jgi:zinc finger protein